MNKNRHHILRSIFLLLLLGALAIQIQMQQDKNLTALTKSKAKKTVTLTPTPTLTAAPASSPTSFPKTLPSQVLDLTNWKLTLPTGFLKRPIEIRQPILATYKIDPWFVVAQGEDAIRFLAPVNGVTTSGSGYPRSELREMIGNGIKNASWSSTSGTHAMFLDQAITAIPTTKKHVVAGQIHDANDDVIVIRLEYPNLYVNVDGKNKYVLDSAYTLGKRFQIKFEVDKGQTRVYYNGSPSSVFTLNKKYSGAYFKAGAYTQSNCSRENSSSLCNENNYGEVVIYQLTVTHQ